MIGSSDTARVPRNTPILPPRTDAPSPPTHPSWADAASMQSIFPSAHLEVAVLGELGLPLPQDGWRRDDKGWATYLAQGLAEPCV